MPAPASPHGFEYPPNAFNDYPPNDFNHFDWNTPLPPAEASNDSHFFDNLLNSTINDPVFDDPAFDYTRATTSNMSSSRAQPGRLSNGYVDLTSPHVDLTTPDSPPRRRKRESPTPGPSAKRQRHGHGTAADPPTRKSPVQVDEIDLSHDDPILDVLQKQREEAVKAQAKPEETVTTFNTFNCVICMDRPTDLTATACGHLFCHTCLMEALIAGENRAGPGEPKRSQCPVCRKGISRTRANDVIPLLLKKGLATQPRRKPDAMPAAAAPKVQ